MSTILKLWWGNSTCWRYFCSICLAGVPNELSRAETLTWMDYWPLTDLGLTSLHESWEWLIQNQTSHFYYFSKCNKNKWQGAWCCNSTWIIARIPDIVKHKLFKHCKCFKGTSIKRKSRKELYQPCVHDVLDFVTNLVFEGLSWLLLLNHTNMPQVRMHSVEGG